MEAIRLRSYQDEMLAASLQQNVIVAMDTGSGKTHVAIARIAAELERCSSSSSKRIWFLAPTVALCQQQSLAIQTHLPAYQTRVLTGADGVEFWTEQRLWDAVLMNVPVVVSTHAVLRDALTHGFVKMEGLSLIVFDEGLPRELAPEPTLRQAEHQTKVLYAESIEYIFGMDLFGIFLSVSLNASQMSNNGEAHHCSGKHPANQIMQNFYHPLLHTASPNVPSILGLSASPIVRTSAKGLDEIETNLNARAITPRKYRTDLIQHVHPPRIEKIVYSKTWVPEPPTLQALHIADDRMDLMQDPYVQELLRKTDEYSKIRLYKTLSKQKTFCTEQIAAFRQISDYIFEELGGWAANWYIWQCLRNFRDMVDQHEELLSEWTTAEKIFLLDQLRSVQACAQNPYEPTTVEVSPKAQHLINLLAHESSPDFTGLVFVKQRATVAALAELLSVHPDVKGRYKLGTFVGTSTHAKRKFKFADKVDLREQQQSLEDFRSGKKNLILGTSVLEEGIDVAACNSVTCFEAPENLKSYIQRRGRARMQGSTYVIFLKESDAISGLEKWKVLEEAMRKTYMDELREVKVLSELEEFEKDDGRTFCVEETGALLTIDNALPHLHHFCATLAAEVYVDSRPQFAKADAQPGTEFFRMEVILPSTLEPRLRKAVSLKLWKSEKNAKKDAAFEAYMNLYRAGLVNNNLLPLNEVDPNKPILDWTDQGPSVVSASGLMNPWKLAVSFQEKAKLWYKYRITISISERESVKMNMLLPGDPGELVDICLYWNETMHYTAHLEQLGTFMVSHTDLDALQQFTKLLLSSVFGTRMGQEKTDFVALFQPLDQKPLNSLLQDLEGRKVASELYGTNPMEVGLVRKIGAEGHSMLFQAFEMACQLLPEYSDTMQAKPELMIKFSKLPKRRDFLHPLQNSEATKDSYTTMDLLPAFDCTIDNLPSRYAMFALFVPSILHKCGLSLIVQDLCETILQPVGFNDLELVQTAITASSASEKIDYQRLEFLGDGILKYYTSIRVFNERPHYPEKYLTAEKSRCVSNATIANATLEKGLDKYIIRAPFTGQKWKPSYVEEVLAYSEERVQISRKVLADVVEALIGAAYIDRGWPKAQTCIEVFFPLEPTTPNQLNGTHVSPSPTVSPASLEKLEELIGYTFTNKALLFEAITHASFTSDIYARSYERLEFLGDAVLDYIITPRLYRYRPQSPLKHYQMHSIRTAVVNADFLAFCCLTFSVSEERNDIVRTAQDPFSFVEKMETVERYLWQYMRKSNSDIVKAQEGTVQRYQAQRDEVRKMLETGEGYPWVQLLRIQADKFFSDLMESVIGAIFLDSGRDLRACERFLERMGVLGVLERILRDGVDVVHPKERLGVLAGNEEVIYRMEVRKGVHHCVVTVGKKEVAIGEGALAEVARTDAATNAVKTLTGK